MNRGQRNALLAALLLVGLSLAGLVVWTLRTSPPVTPPIAIDVPEPVRAPEPPPPEAPERVLESSSPEPAAEVATSVVYALKVDVELLRSRMQLQADDAPPLGSAATAKLKGSVYTRGATPVRVEVRFVAGPNADRVLYSDRNGQFGASDLYPGLSLVRVTGPSIPGSLREVLLRQQRETPLNLGYGRTSLVHGSVKDPDAKPVAGARVTMDGQETATDENGNFLFTAIAPGDVLLFVEKEGFARLRRQWTVAGDTTIEPGKLVLTLDRAARLEVTIPDRLNTGSEALLYVLPENLEGERKYPWHLVNPVRIYPGGTLTIEDLPATTVSLRLFHSGAISKPASRRVGLAPGETERVEFHLEPAPVVTGIVRQGAKPVANAIVRLEMPDRVSAMNVAIGAGDLMSLERELLPNLPPAVQETRTNASGEFVLSANEGVSKQRYLVALSPDGRSTGGKVLVGGETQVDVELVPVTSGEGELVLQLDGRYQPLPVDVTVNGTPRERFLLSPGKDLHVEGLTPGSWKLDARWGSEELAKGQTFELDASTTLALKLPEGAIIGQDDETRLRAGKH
jgi:hypothetical protein